MKFLSESGWILPDGQYIWCQYHEHIRCAKEKMNMSEKEAEKIAIKVTCMPFSMRILNFGSRDHVASFHTQRIKMTEEQMATIEQYCLYFRLRPPPQFFLQKNGKARKI